MIGSELQAAIYAALTAANVAGGRVYDRVPESAAFPYVTIGDEQVLDAGNTCADGWDVYSDVHVWSRPDAGSKGEVKAIMSAAVRAVRAIEALPGFVVQSIELHSSVVARDPDGITEHGALTFRTLVDPA